MYLISRGREFQEQGAAYENERFPNVLVLTCGIRRVESERERSCIDGEYEEGQKSRQGQFWRKRSDKVLTFYTRFVFG